MQFEDKMEKEKTKLEFVQILIHLQSILLHQNKWTNNAR